MQIIETKIPGCYEIQPELLKDDRGSFVKVFNAEDFKSFGLCVDWKEQYYSVSQANVVRGLHFQLPPYDHVKLVYCVAGSVEDVVLDLRRDSPTYGMTLMLELSEEKGNMIYLPRGLAHGFCTTKEPAILVYNVSTIYTREADAGVLWNSAGIDWSVQNPLLSQRDRLFPALDDFESPFLFSKDSL